jgi:hypothetical protein
MTSLSFASKENNKPSTRPQHKTLRHGDYARCQLLQVAPHLSSEMQFANLHAKVVHGPNTWEPVATWAGLFRRNAM